MERRVKANFVPCAVVAARLLTPPGAMAPPSQSPVADKAMAGDREAVRQLLKDGVDVNAAQGDGSTALHWAALKGDSELAQMLRYAGANHRAVTRLGGYTPLFLAARGGHAEVVATLLAGGAEVERPASSGAIPLMMEAAAGEPRNAGMLV